MNDLPVIRDCGRVCSLLQSQIELMTSLSRSQSFEESLYCCLDAAIRAGSMDCGGIYLVKPDGSAHLAVHRGPCDIVAHGGACIEADDILNQYMRTGEPTYTDYAAIIARRNSGEHHQENQEALQAFAIVPVTSDGRVIGCLNLASRSLPEVPEDARETLSALASHIGQAIEREQIHASSREREENLSTFFESVGDFLFVLDEQGQIVRVNPAVIERLGYLESELLGQPVLIVHPAYRRDDAARIVGEMIAGTRDLCDVPLITKAGDLIPVETRVTVGTWNGCRAFFGVSRDISDQLRAEEERIEFERQIQMSQKLESLGVLAGGIAHDFNNILVSVLGNASLALEELPPATPARRYVEDIATASQRAAELCRQMLAYSGRGSFVIEPIDLSGLVAEMTHLLETTASKNALLQVMPESSLPLIRGDATQVRQVTMNLVINASEAVEEHGGIISVTTGISDCAEQEIAHLICDDDFRAGTYVYLEVADTGCGMDRETQDRLFDPFFTTKFTGRGLGMSAVLGIVRDHGGALHIWSEPGKGSTFRVLFPIAAEQTLETPETLVTKTVGNTATGCVLLVDDENCVRTLAKRMLTKLGFQTITAGDGREAVQIYRQRAAEIDLVILDLTMPHMDGCQTFTALCELNPDVRVLITSGYSKQEIRTRFQDQKPAGFIQKPYSLATMNELMSRYMDCVEVGDRPES